MVKHSKNKQEAKGSAKEAADSKAQTDIHETDIPAQETATGVMEEEQTENINRKLDELNDKYLRLYSEFDNYRKRVIKEKTELRKTASEEVISGLLPVLDDFDRAVGTLSGKKEIDPETEGFILIHNKLKNFLSQQGLSEVEAMDREFDTDFHEAIANVPAPDQEVKNKIIDVTQKGYILNGKVIRFAKVVVGI